MGDGEKLAAAIFGFTLLFVVAVVIYFKLKDTTKNEKDEPAKESNNCPTGTRCNWVKRFYDSKECIYFDPSQNDKFCNKKIADESCKKSSGIVIDLDNLDEIDKKYRTICVMNHNPDDEKNCKWEDEDRHKRLVDNSCDMINAKSSCEKMYGEFNPNGGCLFKLKNEGDSCKHQNQCRDEYICKNGKCEVPDCEDDSKCPEGRCCKDGKCKIWCSQSSPMMLNPTSTKALIEKYSYVR